MLKEFIKIAPEMKIKVNASNIAALEKWMKICTPAYVETDILNITHQFKEFCKSNHIKIMAAIQNASEKEYKKAIEVHPDLVNLDRPELFIKIPHQEIKNNPFPRRAMKSTLSYLLIICSLFTACIGHQEESLLFYVDTRTALHQAQPTPQNFSAKIPKSTGKRCLLF